jgi:hypothetical protein
VFDHFLLILILMLLAIITTTTIKPIHCSVTICISNSLQRPAAGAFVLFQAAVPLELEPPVREGFEHG